jgi:hypothetical protein
VHPTRLRITLVLTLILACAGLTLAPAAHAAGPVAWDGPAAWSDLGDRLAGWLESLLDGAFQPTPERLTAASGHGMDPDGDPAPTSGGGMDPNGSPAPMGGGHMDPNG